MIDRRGADYSGQDLAGADLSDSDLTHANFRGAILAGAEFAGSRLIGAHWDGADFSGADLSTSLLSDLRLRVAGWRVVVRRDGTVQVGRCQRRTAEEWAEMGAQDIADLTPEEDAPADFLSERDMVLAASNALMGLY